MSCMLGGGLLMRLKKLEYFVAVARFKSFSLAAKELYVSQPSISQGISNLEDDLGVKLFERARSGISLTEAGEVLLQKAKYAVNIVEEIWEENNTDSKSLHGKLYVSSIPSMSNSFLSEVLSAYKEVHPNVRVEVKEDGSNQILEDVISNRVDIGLLSHNPEEIVNDKLVFNSLMTGTYLACVGRKSSVPLHNPIPREIISKEPMITFKPNFAYEQYLKRILKTDQLNILITLGYTEVAKKVITEGIAIAFYPDFSIKNDPYVLSGDIIPLEIENNDLLISFGWIRAKNYYFSKAGQEFIKTLKRVIQEKGGEI